jgi:hypothetical protein
MDAITVSAVVGEDRRLVIDLPADTPVGPVDVVIKPHVSPEADVTNPAREAARAKLLAAGKLATAARLGIPDDLEYLSDDELEELGRMPPGARPSEELINEDRGEY